MFVYIFYKHFSIRYIHIYIYINGHSPKCINTTQLDYKVSNYAWVIEFLINNLKNKKNTLILFISNNSYDNNILPV